MKILVAKDGSRVGPYSKDEIFARLNSAELSSTDLGWHEGLPAWIPLAQLIGSDNPIFVAPPIPINVAQPVRYAGFWRRAAAILIDAIVLLFLLFLIGFAIAMAIYAIYGEGMTELNLEPFGNLLGGMTIWLYFAFMESSHLQGTVGKLVLGIKVTDESGGRISFGRATGRHFGKVFASMLSLGIGLVLAGFTKRKQALHDLMSDCLVVCR